MNRRQLLKLALIGSLPTALGGCTISEVRRSINASKNIIKGDYNQAIANQVPGVGVPEVDGFIRKGFKHFLDDVSALWKDDKTPSPKVYVKYTDHFKSRAIIDFNLGSIEVETLIDSEFKIALKNAIVQTLLTPEDPSAIDLYSAQAPTIGQTPFLIDLIRDHDNQEIRYQWRAQRFAGYLIKTHYQKVTLNKVTRHKVRFNMVADFKSQQGKHYQYLVSKQASRFGLERALVFSIIETESSFNPYAVSSAPAFGLMQIVPSTAGRDVFRFLHKRDGMPTQNQLFSAATNIEYGSAYLHILFNRYLKDVRNPSSKEFCVIAAYNTGTGNVLKSFDANRKIAMDKINRLSSEQVYQHLRKHLSSSEARNYLFKVTKNKQKYA